MKKNYLSQSIYFLLYILFSSLNLTAQIYITDPEDLEDLVNAALVTGGTFIVSNGTYNDFEATFEVAATSTNPIIIKAETIGGVTLTGDSGFVLKKSSYITIEGFVLDTEDAGTLVKFEGSNHIRITRNVFEQTSEDSAKWIYIGGVWDDDTEPYQYLSHTNRIDHNIFKNKDHLGHYITIDGTNSEQQSQYDRIDHNYFKNNGPRATNEQESIRIGWSEMSQSSGYTTVEFNLFEDCDGDPEIVSVKSCDNTIRHNTFISSYGTLSLRHGNRNRVEGNYFFGNGKAIGTSETGSTLYTGGIRIYGTDHVIINNYMEGLTGTKWDAPITLTQGDAIDGSSTSWSKHFRAERVTIAYNTLVNNSHGIEIGYDNNDAYSKDLADITIANNLITGSENSLVEIVDTDNDQGDKITWVNNLFYPTGTAVVLSGASTTSFDSSEVVNENPNLTFDSGNNLWRSTAMTPLYANGVTIETISEDFDGQDRALTSNPGADHFSMESVRYLPMTMVTVGPNAYEVDDESENLYVSTLSDFDADGGTGEFIITSNVDWTLTEGYDWVSVSSTTGSDTATITVTVAANKTFEERNATITVTGGDLTRSLSFSQEGADPKADLVLIKDHVTIESFFAEQVTDTKNNVAIHALDKDFDTQWSGESVDLQTGGEVIFNLGGTYDLALIDFATTSGKTYEFQLWVSTSGTATEDFVNPFTDQENSDGHLESNSTGEFETFILSNVALGAKYVKYLGYGQPGRPSNWNTISEIEFYKTDSSLSLENNDLTKVLMYHVDSEQSLHLENLIHVNAATLYSIEGRKLLSKTFGLATEGIIDVSGLTKGVYVVRLTGNQFQESRLVLIGDN